MAMGGCQDVATCREAEATIRCNKQLSLGEHSGLSDLQTPEMSRIRETVRLADATSAESLSSKTHAMYM